MTIDKLRIAVGALWIAAMGVVGWATGTQSITNWILLAALTFVPPLVLARFWRTPARSMSESIQDALR